MTYSLNNKNSHLLNIYSTEHTLTIGEDGDGVDVVGVAVIDLYTFPCHQPPSDTSVVAAR